jgi:hypothetical protein
MVDAARRYGRVFSCGSQSVHKHSKIARPVQKGELGQIHRAYVNCGGPSRPCGLPGRPVPEGMEWDLWLGPAPWAPYHPFRCGRAHGLKGEGWRTWYDYSGGMMTDFGAHHFGAAMFALGLDHTGPVEILPPKHSPLRKLTYRFACGLEMCHGSGPGSGDGVARYEVAEGNVPGLTWQPPTHLLKRDYRGGLDNRGRVSLPGDFLHCVRTREKPFRDVEYAHRVATVCHLGNIAYLLNRPLKWDPDKEEFVGDDEANRHTWRSMRGPWRIG